MALALRVTALTLIAFAAGAAATIVPANLSVALCLADSFARANIIAHLVRFTAAAATTATVITTVFVYAIRDALYRTL